MSQKRYSREFMQSAVEKVMNRGSRTITDICDELGVSTASIVRWRNDFGNMTGMKKITQRPQDTNAHDRMKSVIDYFSLPEDQRGEYLRKQGLHSDHLEHWRSQFEEALGSSTNKSDRAQSRRKIRELEKELRRKDKALAETTALLVLKKKADLIWGTGEDE